MSIYSTPSIIKETLGNGGRIPFLFYIMNPMREPAKRINYYKNLFRNEKKEVKVPKKKIKSVKKMLFPNLFKSKVYMKIKYNNSLKNLVENKRKIINKHFKSLLINSKKYPNSKIQVFSIKEKPPDKVQDKGTLNSTGCNFFSTEIKIINNNIIKSKINQKSEKEKINNLFSSLTNNSFSQTTYIPNNNIFKQYKMNLHYFNKDSIKVLNYKTFNVRKKSNESSSKNSSFNRKVLLELLPK